jgi:hypothetical protein
MADIVLAEHRGQTWLVSGEGYIDDLLANTLPRDVSIEFVACESQSEVNVLWVQNCGQPSDGGAPWIIHPAIATRIRGTVAGHSVFFSQWSAMLDEDAHSVIRAAAVWAADSGDTGVVLTMYVAPESAKAMVDLANLRSSLIEAELTALGVAPHRIARDTRDVATVPGMGAESQRVDIIMKTGP